MSQEQKGWMVQASWCCCVGAPSTPDNVSTSQISSGKSHGNIIKRAKWLTRSVNRVIKTCENLMVLSQNCKGIPIKIIEWLG